MRFSTLGYSIKQGVKNIWRNKMFSLASIATMGACIFLFGIFFAVVINFNYIVKKCRDRRIHDRLLQRRCGSGDDR